MRYPSVIRRPGAIPGLVRLVALTLEWTCLALLMMRRKEDSYTTDYLILGYLIMIDFIEIVCLCGQPRAWPLSALPMLIAGDSIGVLMLVCSRDWYGFWYWHGPYYSLSREIGIWLFIALPVLRAMLICLEGSEYWFMNREDQILAAERRALLPY